MGYLVSANKTFYKASRLFPSGCLLVGAPLICKSSLPTSLLMTGIVSFKDFRWFIPVLIYGVQHHFTCSFVILTFPWRVCFDIFTIFPPEVLFSKEGTLYILNINLMLEMSFEFFYLVPSFS